MDKSVSKDVLEVYQQYVKVWILSLEVKDCYDGE